MLTKSVMAVGTFALLPKAALAALIALLLLRTVDRRLSTLPWAILFGLTGAATGFLCFWHTTEFWERLAWMAAASIATLHTLASIRTWLTCTPDQLHVEAQRTNAVQPKKNAKPKKAKFLRHSEPEPKIGSGESIVCWAAAVSAIAGSLLINYRAFGDLQTTWLLLLHQWLLGMACGVAGVVAVEITFLNAPHALSPNQGPRTHWKPMAWTALIILLAELLICCCIFFSDPPDVGIAFPDLLLSRMFAISLMVVHWIAWMIPQRVAGFQAQKRPAAGWASLALSAWLVLLALTVVSALPTVWPWHLL